MPCTVTTNCSLCGQQMSGEYPQGLAAAVTALLNEHNELRKCHRDLEEKIENEEKAESTWRERHDAVVNQREKLKAGMLYMQERGALKPEDLKAKVLSDATLDDLLNEVARRAQ